MWSHDALASKRNILYPTTIMDDTKSPATKADITRLENRLGERFDKIDERFDGIDERFDNLVERMESGFDAVTARVDRVLAMVGNDKERLDDHEKRLTKLETAVGIAS
jgi:DNA repair ATPase RecN